MGLNFPARYMCYFWCSGVYVFYHVGDTLVLMSKKPDKLDPYNKTFSGIN